MVDNYHSCIILKKLFYLLSCRKNFYLLILVVPLTSAGCWNHLGQDTTILDENERIAAQVKVALAQETDFDVAPIDIKAYDGVVTLRGFVEGASRRQRAEKVASLVPGVQSVINDIQIKNFP